MPNILRTLRSLLVLARASNIPTVWSNCLAAWCLTGGDDEAQFLLLCLGATLLYVGGMFLNDAFDVEFDRQFRRERPIPSGAIGQRLVWGLGTLWLILGVAVFTTFSQTAAILAALLASVIVLYDSIHKRTMLGPLLMAACRFLLYLLAGAVARNINGWVVWSALVLALYIVGLSYIARAESAPGPLRFWPCLFLGAPLALAYLVNDGSFRAPNFLYSGIFAVWTLFCIGRLFWAKRKDVSACVTGLLAGIVWLDLLNVGGSPHELALIFVLLFLATRIFQRFIPAT